MRCPGDHLLDVIEVAGTDELLVRDGIVSVLVLALEFRILQAAVRFHAFMLVAARELEHGMIQRMEAGQRDELELVAHRRDVTLKTRDRGVVQIFAPVERRRAVVSQQLAGEFRVNAIGEFARFVNIGLGSFAPDHVRVRRVGNCARDGRLVPPRTPKNPSEVRSPVMNA